MTDHTPAAQAAMQEGERIAAADEYFSARTWIMDTNDNRRIFEAGFDRAYALLSKLRAPVADERAVRIPVPFSVDTTHKNQAFVTLGFYDEALRKEFVRAVCSGGFRVPTAAMASAPVAGEAQRLFAIPAQHSGVVLSMVGATLHIQRDGSGQIVVAEDDFTLEDDRSEGPDGPQGSAHWVARLPASELTALRHFLNGYARPSDDALWDRTLTERDEYHDMADKLANAIADHLLVEIGEHSSSNCPWMRALDAIQNAAPQASEAARDALVPFAALEDADLIGTAFEGKGDDAEILHFHRTGKSVTLGDFRRARAALSAQPGAQKEQSDA